MPRGGGKGGTLLRARFFSCDTNSRHLHFHNQYLRTRGTGGVQPASLYNDCFSRKQADAQSGGSAKRYRSDCSWLCFHCLPASLNKGHLASPLVNANSVWTNEAQRSEAEWVNTLFATFLEDEALRTKRPVESGSGTKYGWSERQ